MADIRQITITKSQFIKEEKVNSEDINIYSGFYGHKIIYINLNEPNKSFVSQKQKTEPFQLYIDPIPVKNNEDNNNRQAEVPPDTGE